MHDANNGISVVISTYNSEKFIKKTLISLENQKKLPEEIIFSDDGSTDKTTEIIELWLKKNNNIKCKILKNQHGGPGYARNIGINNSNFEWIAFLDSDDTWDKNKILETKKAISNELNINFIAHYEIHEDKYGIRKEISRKLKDFENSKKKLSKFLYISNIFSTSAVICKKSLLKEKGLFDPNLLNGQDYDLWLKLSPKINLYVIKKNLGTYYDTINNISSRPYFKRIKAELIICFRYRKLANFSLFLIKLFKIIINKNWFKF